MSEELLQEAVKSLTNTTENIRKLAERVLPKGSPNQTEIERLMRASIPDTYEWFDVKFSMITELESMVEILECIEEWQQYVCRKADELLVSMKKEEWK